MGAGPSSLQTSLRHTLGLLAAGTLGPLLVLAAGLGGRDRLDGNALFHFVAAHEPIQLSLAGALVLAMLWLARRPRGQDDGIGAPRRPMVAAALIGLGAALIARVGGTVVFGDFLLSGDEEATDWLARQLLSGRVHAPIPEAVIPIGNALESPFTRWHPVPEQLRAAYLPIYAAIRAGFAAIGAVSWTNPALVLASVVGVAATVRNLLPARPEIAVGVALLVATSSQVLVNGMTGYAMAGHLALNAVWLALWTSGRRRAWAAPLLGFLAMGLHNPLMHPLFVAPFLLRPLRDRRWLFVAWIAVVYGIASLVWLRWFRWTYPIGASYIVATDAPLSVPFAFPDALRIVIQSSYLTLAGTWVALPALGLAGVALTRWRELPAVGRDCIASIALTLALFVFFVEPQGNGWGYRYLHGVLACVFVLAALGAGFQRTWTRRDVQILAIGIGGALLLQLPLRGIQIQRYVAPFAETDRWLHEQPEDLILVDPISVWYGVDLIRNPDPQARPLILNTRKARRQDVQALVDMGWSVRVITTEELTAHGMSPLTGLAGSPQ